MTKVRPVRVDPAKSRWNIENQFSDGSPSVAAACFLISIGSIAALAQDAPNAPSLLPAPYINNAELATGSQPIILPAENVIYTPIQQPMQLQFTPEMNVGSDKAGAFPAQGANSEGLIVSQNIGNLPSSLTSPLLPDMPSSLSEGNSPQTPVPEDNPTDAPINQTVDTQRQESVKDTETAQTEDSEAKANGPELRKSNSALVSLQRPFLLYARDASITYLMPNALASQPELGRYLRELLERRALNLWQSQRINTKGDDRDLIQPPLVITGRIEDRYYSSDLISLYLEEVKSLDEETQPNKTFAFNYSSKDKAALNLKDLFKGKDNNSLATIAELIHAYVKADIVRQKSVRLGANVSPDKDAWLENLTPGLDLLENFTLVPSRESGKISGLRFHFNPGILGAEADGSYQVYVPASIFAGSLAERFTPIFGGEMLMASRHFAKGFSTAATHLEGLKSGAELGGDMLIEGEVPANWCDGFHLTLTDQDSSAIVTEGVVELLPDLPSYGLAGDMLRFRASLSVSGAGTKSGILVFEPYAIREQAGRAVLREKSACDPHIPIDRPDPNGDAISIPVSY